MDWITTSGSSIHEAKSNALDQLGIVADEAEFDIINDVEKGLFGRVKAEAKVRTRVKPKQSAVKDDRRRRSGGGSGGGGKGRSGGNGSSRNDQKRGKSKKQEKAPAKERAGGGTGGAGGGSRREKSGDRTGKSTGGRRDRSDQRDDRAVESDTDKTQQSAPAKQRQPKKDTVDHEFSRQQQTDVATGFLEGLLTAFELEGSVAVVPEPAEDEAIEITVTGSELGRLVGQKGVTLNAVQELTRTVVQREADGAKTERLRVDVAGYRERRRAALEQFAESIAADVVDSGTEKVMEPMGPADRKVVHDALTDYAGVETGSEGEEPRRRVVIRPT